MFIYNISSEAVWGAYYASANQENSEEVAKVA
jgi:hypothetical protein